MSDEKYTSIMMWILIIAAGQNDNVYLSAMLSVLSLVYVIIYMVEMIRGD